MVAGRRRPRDCLLSVLSHRLSCIPWLARQLSWHFSPRSGVPGPANEPLAPDPVPLFVTGRINQLMADAANPEEPAQPEPPAEIDPRMEKMQRLMNASFPPQPRTAASTATTAPPRTPEQRRQQQPEYGR